jgi:hypothetical protein
MNISGSLQGKPEDPGLCDDECSQAASCGALSKIDFTNFEAYED